MNKKINLLLTISSLEYGGAERQLIEIYNNIDRDIFNPYLCTFSDNNPLSEKMINNDQLITIPKKSKFDLSTIFRLRRLLKEKKIDIIHAFLLDAEIISRMAGLLAKTPVVIGSERNTDYELTSHQYIAQKLTLPTVDAIIANSHSGSNFFREYLGISKEKSYVLYNGVNTNRFKPDSSYERKNILDIDDDTFLIGMVAKYKTQKRYEDFLHLASKLAANQNIKFRFMIIGDKLNQNQQGSSDYYNMIMNLYSELNLQDVCTILEPVQEIEHIYNICDLIILPSSREGVPNVLLESMACGTPVITTDISDNKLIIDEGKTGHVVDLGDIESMYKHINRIASDKSLLDTMKVSCQEWISKHFSNQIMIQNLQNIYLELWGKEKK